MGVCGEKRELSESEGGRAASDEEERGERENSRRHGSRWRIIARIFIVYRLLVYLAASSSFSSSASMRSASCTQRANRIEQRANGR